MYVSYLAENDSTLLSAERAARHSEVRRSAKRALIGQTLLVAAAIGGHAARFLLRRDRRASEKKETQAMKSVKTTINTSNSDVTIKPKLVQARRLKSSTEITAQEVESDLDHDLDCCNGKDQSKPLGLSKSLPAKASAVVEVQSPVLPMVDKRSEELQKENDELKASVHKLEAQLNSVISFLYIVDLSKVPTEVLRDYATSLAAGSWKRGPTAGTNLVVDYHRPEAASSS